MDIDLRSWVAANYTAEIHQVGRLRLSAGSPARAFYGLEFNRGAGSSMRPRANLRRASNEVRCLFRDIVQNHGRQVAKAE